MDSLHSQIGKLEAAIPNLDTLNLSVSNAPVGWHIEHSLITIQKIIQGVLKSDAAKYVGDFKLMRLVVLGLGYIPRGKVTAPDVVQPKAPGTLESLADCLKTTRKLHARLGDITTNQHFSHPVLGTLNKKPMVRFLEVHTNHHLKIIRDILEEH